MYSVKILESLTYLNCHEHVHLVCFYVMLKLCFLWITLLLDCKGSWITIFKCWNRTMLFFIFVFCIMHLSTKVYWMSVYQYSDEGMGHLMTWFGSDSKREIQGQHASSPPLPPPYPAWIVNYCLLWVLSVSLLLPDWTLFHETEMDGGMDG
jgi:hypothetical protein